VTLTPSVVAAVSVNPATGAHVGEYPFIAPRDLETKLEMASRGQIAWTRYSAAERATVFRCMAAVLRAQKVSFAHSITTEVGKPITQSRDEVLKAADALDWYADHAESLLADLPTDAAPHGSVRIRPLGSILAVEPWNFPVWQIMRGGAGIMLAGNAYLLKPAPNAVGTALLLEAAWVDAGLPPGAFTVLNAAHEEVAQAIASPLVSGVTVTGGPSAGAAIAQLAARVVKPTVLELGGNDPFIVMADADLDRVIPAAVTARFTNSGQVCIAAKRFIVESAVEAEFTERLVAAVQTLRVGDPLDPTTDLGPLAREDLLEEIRAQIARAVSGGARIETGGTRLSRPGFYLEPTVLSQVGATNAAFTEEIFGPVAAVTRADSPEDALVLANQSAFGLSASVWSGNPALAERIADGLEAGSVFINKPSVSDVRLPIGGVKGSGYGRELARAGVLAFANLQTRWTEPVRQPTPAAPKESA
jgi:succinate-semialdehyde dehydrogenase